MLDVLARDTSRFALRPSDPAWAASLAVEINQCANDSVPDSTLAKDTFAWKEWMRHCDRLNTVAWRLDRNDLDSDEHARERFLFDSFLIEDYKRMVRAKPTPQSPAVRLAICWRSGEFTAGVESLPPTRPIQTPLCAAT